MENLNHRWRFVTCFIVVVSGIFQTSSSHQCDLQSIPFFKDIGFALVGHVIDTRSHVQPYDCLWSCKANPSCFSVNIERVKQGPYRCELNNSTKEADRDNLIEKPGFEYIAFLIDVHRYGSGSYFQRAIFPDGWYLQKDALFKYFPTNKTWLDAKDFCQSIGGDLATISDADQNEFVYRNLIPPAKHNLSNGCTRSIADMIGCWLLDDTESEVILRKGPYYTDDDSNGITALYLDGNGSFADVPAVSLQFPAITIMCWLKVLEPAKTPGGIPFNVWIHVAVTWDQANRTAKIFVNGQEKGSKTASVGLSSYEMRSNSHSYYQVGCKLDTTETFFGFVRNIKVLKRLLSNDEVEGEAAKNPRDTQLKAWLGLNDLAKEGNYVWNDGAMAKFSNWVYGKTAPESVDQDCAVMIQGDKISGGKWKNRRCTERHPFICRKSMTSAREE
ncbi:macrophage mannose receptor 1-like isoform X2 [Acropora palmata]|uniref:macrophage mannose receptor 1-like isoform X2 n=1 Tax=Acropora palmata TaxID=6131 RepID=UPI003DA094A7